MKNDSQPIAARIHRHGGPEAIAIELQTIPEPGPGEVLVRIAFAGVNPIDWKMRDGGYGPGLPYTPGEDLSGTVERVGDGVTDLQAGDAVFGMLGMDRPGAFASYAVAPAAWLATKPAAMGFDEAAALPMGALTAWIALFDIGELEAGQRLLVHGGAGAVGAAAVQLAKSRGVCVAATASADDPHRVLQIGADLAIDRHSERFEQVLQQEGGVDLVLDTIAGETRERSWAALREGGAVVSTLGETVPPQDARGLRGLPGFGAGPDGARLSEIAALSDKGLLRTAVGAVLPLARAADAMEMVRTGGAAGKVLLRAPTQR